MAEIFFTAGDIVRRMNGEISTDGIRWARMRGYLRAATRTAGGVYLFRESDVERWIAQRQRDGANDLLAAANGGR